MICDLELLKLADGEQTNHVTADNVFSGECPDPSSVWNFLASLTMVFCSGCQRYSSECSCALSNRAFLPAIVNSSHLCLLVVFFPVRFD